MSRAIFRDLLRSLRRLSGVGEHGVEDAIKSVKNVKTGFKTLDDVLGDLTVTRNERGFLEFNGETAGRVESLFKSGDLDAVVRLSGRDVPITSASRAAYRELVGETSERALKDLEDSATRVKSRLSQLDTTVENMDKLSNSAKRDVRTIESRVAKIFKTGTVIALTVGVVAIGTNWLIKATEGRKGCWMFTEINGKVSSCKISAFSCNAPNTGSPFCSRVPKVLYNNTLVLINLAARPDTDEAKQKLASELGVEPSELSKPDVLAGLVDRKFPEISTAIAKLTDAQRQFEHNCDALHPRLYPKKVDCIMCSSTDNPTSVTFIDPRQYPENVSFRCITNPSILDTLTDLADRTGSNILDGLSGGWSGSLKSIAVWLIAIVLLVVLASLVLRFAKPKPGSATAVPVAPETLVPYQRLA